MLMALLPSNEPALQTPLWGSRSGPPDSLPATRAGMALRPSKFPFPNQLTPSPIPPCTCRPLDSSPASTRQSFSALPCLLYFCLLCFLNSSRSHPRPSTALAAALTPATIGCTLPTSDHPCTASTPLPHPQGPSSPLASPTQPIRHPTHCHIVQVLCKPFLYCNSFFPCLSLQRVMLSGGWSCTFHIFSLNNLYAPR